MENEYSPQILHEEIKERAHQIYLRRLENTNDFVSVTPEQDWHQAERELSKEMTSKGWNWGFKGKTGFELVQLFLFPLLLVLLGSLFPIIQQRIADEQYREEALQSYYKDMRELILDKNLKSSSPRDEVVSIARARTLSVFKQLDTQRKGLITLFLKESNLITLKIDDQGNLIRVDGKGSLTTDQSGRLLSQTGIISMSGADLTDTNLNNLDLRYVSFWHTNLTSAQLKGADLRYANLSKSNLEGANLNGANLSDANLDGAVLDKASMKGTRFCNTIMPNGKVSNDTC
jgi:uncharacterized protein YjbI with pentapeptide repeats